MRWWVFKDVAYPESRVLKLFRADNTTYVCIADQQDPAASKAIELDLADLTQMVDIVDSKSARRVDDQLATNDVSPS